jgi:hypothetical protein
MSDPRPSREEQRLQIEHCDVPLVLGDTWCLVPMSWWAKWTAYVGYRGEQSEPDAVEPAGPIPTSELLEHQDTLRSTVQEGKDFFLVHSSAFDKLAAW